MGTIDKTTYKFFCSNCNSVEILTVLQKGSNWSGSWQIPLSEKFKIFWGNNNFGEPTPKTCVCIVCQINANHSLK